MAEYRGPHPSHQRAQQFDTTANGFFPGIDRVGQYDFFKADVFEIDSTGCAPAFHGEPVRSERKAFDLMPWRG